jgi:hypothetical protein
MATDFVAAVAKMRGYVGVYLAALAKGPLNAHQAASLETDLKTLDADLAALGLLALLAAPATFAITGSGASVPPPVVQPADPPEVVFDPATWPPLAVAAGTVRMGKYGEVFGSALPAANAYSDVQTSGGFDGSSVPPMFYLFLRGKIIYAQEGNVDPAERIAKKTEHRPANTTGLI